MSPGPAKPSASSPARPEPTSVTGVQLMQGIGARPALGFWADAWSQIIKRPSILLALAWISLLAFFAVYAPVLASGHPILLRELDRRTAADASSALRALAARPSATEADVRAALDRETSRHAGAPAADVLFPVANPAAAVSPDRIAALADLIAARTEFDATGGVVRTRSPLWEFLGPLDIVLLVLATGGVPYILLGSAAGRAGRVWTVLSALLTCIAVIALSDVIRTRLNADALEVARELATRAVRTGQPLEAMQHFARNPAAGYVVGGVTGGLVAAIVVLLPVGGIRRRATVGIGAALLAVVAFGARWEPAQGRFDHAQRAAAGQVEIVGWAPIPWSPLQRFSELSRNEPGASRWRSLVVDATASLPPAGLVDPETIRGVAPALQSSFSSAPPAVRDAALKALESAAAAGPATRPQLRRLIDEPLPNKFLLGTDKDGADVLSQLLHACRLSISIGLVSTSVALLIGVTMGALMGYFGGWLDLLLYRVVEIFMAVPVLFLLIVAVAVLPADLRSPYVVMAIIGAFTWTGMARFTRAEFLKLRNQDFVQAAQAAGLPLRSILFKHMLPNGVAPVLVDTSFAIAAAIGIEATLSYLGLGPTDTASWGRLLSSAISSEGEFKWWLAVFPGAAIFLTVLSYNLIGEALRDAIDPKLKKAAV